MRNFLFSLLCLIATPSFGKYNCLDIFSKFPSHQSAIDEQGGVLPVELPMTINNLIDAYNRGFFPWRDNKWFSPPMRGILFLDQFRNSKRIYKRAEKQGLRVTFDQAFMEVIRGCQQMNRENDRETWITEEFIEKYYQLHRLGYAHSVEVWLNGKVVGGSYGVMFNGVFAGESIFHTVDNAGTFAMQSLVDKLQSMGVSWVDTQVLNPSTKSLGATEIPRDEYLKLLLEAKEKNILWKN